MRLGPSNPRRASSRPPPPAASRSSGTNREPEAPGAGGQGVMDPPPSPPHAPDHHEPDLRDASAPASVSHRVHTGENSPPSLRPTQGRAVWVSLEAHETRETRARETRGCYDSAWQHLHAPFSRPTTFARRAKAPLFHCIHFPSFLHMQQPFGQWLRDLVRAIHARSVLVLTDPSGQGWRRTSSGH